MYGLIQLNRKSVFEFLAITVVILCAFSFCPPTADAHGGKTHGENEFTAFKAIEKAVEMYEKLIVTGKLDESWETDLVKLEIATVNNGGKIEYMVSFHRREAEPSALFIFFAVDGSYTGSNFTGP